MSDELHKYPGNLKHHKVDETISTHLRIIADQAELIQRMVDAIAYSRKHGPAATLGDCHWDIALHNALSDASQLGFKPTDQ